MADLSTFFRLPGEPTVRSTVRVRVLIFIFFLRFSFNGMV